MESQPNQPPLVVIVGETASGKSALAMRLARHFDGEIVCADSRTIYKDMDIGTAKPTPEDRAAIPHHMLDLVSPNERFTVAQFKAGAQKAIDEIASRGHIAFLVGGTGLYIDAILYDFTFAGEPDLQKRAQLAKLSTQELQDLLRAQEIDLPQNFQNPRHLIRTLETAGIKPGLQQLRKNTLVIGLTCPRENLVANISARIEKMFALGFTHEARSLVDQYGWDTPGLQTSNYKALRPYLEGETTLEATKEACISSDLHLAKRQRTWFKRNKSIHWLENQEDSDDLVTTFLNKL